MSGLLRGPGRLALAILLVVGPAALAADLSPLPLVPVFRTATGERSGPLTTVRPEGTNGVPAFFAVLAEPWPSGFVPLFGVEREDRVELSRRPRSGYENNTEPLFFALPADGETNAARIAGRWELSAVRGDGSKVRLAWELTAEGDRLSGRFDQTTEYRYAYLSGGTLRSNRFELKVQNAMDHYEVHGELTGTRLVGDWRRTDEGEQGSWEATRVPVRAVQEAGRRRVALYQWRRTSDGAVRYEPEGTPVEAGWERAARPLGLVWR